MGAPEPGRPVEAGTLTASGAAGSASKEQSQGREEKFWEKQPNYPKLNLLQRSRVWEGGAGCWRQEGTGGERAVLRRSLSVCFLLHLHLSWIFLDFVKVPNYTGFQFYGCEHPLAGILGVPFLLIPLSSQAGCWTHKCRLVWRCHLFLVIVRS